MFRHALRAIPAAVALPVAAIGLAAIAAARPNHAGTAGAVDLGPQLAAVRKATERYRDVRVAVAEGYVQEGPCVALPGVGAMGVHFVHPKNMGLVMKDGRIDGTDTEIDPTKPELLIYEPKAHGAMELVAVEYYTSQAAWGKGPQPTFYGVPFNDMKDDPSTPDVDEGHGFTPHFDLHVWLYRENPRGTFAQWNPAVTCPAGAPAAHAGH